MDTLEPWYAQQVAADWRGCVDQLMGILQEEEKLLEIVQLVGSDSLPERQQLTLEVARMVREFMLQQNAFHEVDTFCELKKSYLLMKTILHYASLANAALDQGARVKQLLGIKSKDRIAEAKFDKGYEALLKGVQKEMDAEFNKL
jgi:V/A-type H+-transporting ATPase subunit A